LSGLRIRNRNNDFNIPICLQSTQDYLCLRPGYDIVTIKTANAASHMDKRGTACVARNAGGSQSKAAPGNGDHQGSIGSSESDPCNLRAGGDRNIFNGQQRCD
jgi:hypothetical protein